MQGLQISCHSSAGALSERLRTSQRALRAVRGPPPHAPSCKPRDWPPRIHCPLRCLPLTSTCPARRPACRPARPARRPAHRALPRHCQARGPLHRAQGGCRPATRLSALAPALPFGRQLAQACVHAMGALTCAVRLLRPVRVLHRAALHCRPRRVPPLACVCSPTPQPAPAQGVAQPSTSSSTPVGAIVGGAVGGVGECVTALAGHAYRTVCWALPA